MIKLVNKKPKYSEKHSCYYLDFGGKSQYSSVKNMILIDESSEEKALLFCKTDKDEFLSELYYPLNPFIALGIILTSFDFKLICQ